ncbi:hypothetical protein [Hymenobacter sp. IS2118]|uniref:hypothetical protein n=1 Tax=Hymenobacter sp. IS2118 TaxID=1505605 RepID=UPI0012694357|nr:hypothetical protein [Hymenobacter sp. IS2118]
MKQTLPTFAQVKAQYADQYIPYQTRLGTQEWKIKRDAMVERDEEECTKCGCRPTDNVWLGGKMHYLLYVPYDPNEVVEINGFTYTGKELGYEIHQLNAAVVLHVHHLYYITSKNPWEYENDALVTLCSDCHSEVHRTEIIPVYKVENGQRERITGVTCSRCSGAGYFPQYKSVENGVCFQCRGSRYTNLTL